MSPIPWPLGSAKLTGSPAAYAYGFASRASNSPYGWFIRYIVARYTGETTEGPGSGCATKTGNPSGAKVACLEPINEPNFEWWPQTGTENVDRAREAMQTCDFWCGFYAANYGYSPWTLGPGTADRTETLHCANEVCSSQPAPGSKPKNTPYGDYTNALLAQLQGWPPYGRVYWSHHNYRTSTINASGSTAACTPRICCSRSTTSSQRRPTPAGMTST